MKSLIKKLIPFAALEKMQRRRWREKGANGPAASAYAESRLPGLNDTTSRILTDLQRDGIAITHVDDLFADQSLYAELVATVNGQLDEFAEPIAQRRSQADDESVHKSFIFNLATAEGKEPMCDPASVYVRFGLQPEIHALANAYLGMQARFSTYNTWLTFPTKVAARDSQLWHADPEDFHIFKVFVMLRDVDECTGPFTYAKGSQPVGPATAKRQQATTLHGGRAGITDAELEPVIPPANWVKGLGREGTLVFADTRGLHKGGLARQNERLLYTCMYLSPDCESYFMRRSNQFDYSHADPVVQAALTCPPGREATD